jgi:hypothetical protein
MFPTAAVAAFRLDRHEKNAEQLAAIADMSETMRAATAGTFDITPSDLALTSPRV